VVPERQRQAIVGEYVFIIHVCFERTTTISLALSKRQYESNFQTDNSIKKKAPGSNAMTEKV
jgi:hypothetical protein